MSAPQFTLCVLIQESEGEAGQLAQTLLPLMDDDWQLLCIDCRDNRARSAFTELAQLARRDARVKLLQTETNQGFARHYFSCFSAADATYLSIVSECYLPNVAMIRQVLPLLAQYPSVGVMRGAIAGQDGAVLQTYPEASFFAGQEAMLGLFLESFQFSGIIYHRDLLQDLNIVDIASQRIDDYAVVIYPQLYLELLAAAVSDVVTTATVSCFALAADKAESYAPPAAFGSRIDQFVVFRNALWDAVGLTGNREDTALFAALYLKLCDYFMGRVCKADFDLYLACGLHPGLLNQSLFHLSCAAIVKMPEMAALHDYLLKEIRALYDKYYRHIQSLDCWK